MRKFGIEIECAISDNAAIAALASTGLNVSDRRNGYHESNDFSKWRVEYDSSVNNGCEIVSPVLEGEDGFEQIRKIVKALSTAGGRINRSCGLHVHVQASDLDGQWLKNIMSRYDANADAIDAFMPPSRREGGYANRQYCNRFSDGVNSSSFARATSVDGVRRCFYDRYVTVNLQPLTRLGTIEFRQHAGTLNADKILNWVGFCQQFIESSRPVEVTQAVDSRINDNGNGISLEGLTVKRRKLVEALISAGTSGHTTAYLALQSGFSVGSVVATISYLRSQRRLQIRKSNGFYTLSGATRRVATLDDVEAIPAPLASLWTGIDPTIAQFYEERTAEFSAEG